MSAVVLARTRGAGGRRALDARWLLLGVAGALVVWLVSAPLAFFLLTAFRRTEDVLPFEPGASWTLTNFADVYGNPVLYRAVLPDTLLYTAGAVVITMTLGVLLAWLVERTNVPFPDVLFVALVSPVIVPTVVVAIAWVVLLGPNAGYINVLLRSLLGLSGPGPLDIFSLGGLIVAQGLALVPLSFLFMAVAFRNMDPALEEASALARARPLTTFVRVTLPLLSPAILALLIVVTTLTLEGFEVPLVIGVPAGVKVLSTWIFFAINPPAGLPNYGRVAAIAVPFLAFGIVLLYLYNRALRVAERYATVTGRAYRPRRLDLGRWRYPALALVALYLLLVLVLPAAIMLLTALHPPGTAAVSLDAFASVLGSPVTRLAFRNTLIAGGLGATIVIFCATMVSWLVVRTRVPGRAVLDVMTFVPITIPAVVTGVAIGLLYLVLPLGIYGTVWILVLAYATRMAVATRVIRASLTQIHRELEEASAVSRARWLQTFRRVLLPLLASAIGFAWLLLFIVSFREFTLGMLLFRPDNIVVGVHLWSLYERGRLGEASALGFVMIVSVLALAFVARRLLRPRLGEA
ncbi:MAG: ABC transporter permease [Candidatus Rokuibacteriota bacterium]